MAKITIPITIDFEGIKDIENADIVKVVRCKDCKHRPEHLDSETICPCVKGETWYSWFPEDDWFCADGESKE